MESCHPFPLPPLTLLIILSADTSCPHALYQKITMPEGFRRKASVNELGPLLALPSRDFHKISGIFFA